MVWLELTLKGGENRKVMQRIDQIGDIYMDENGDTCISPIYMCGKDYTVKESYKEIQRVLCNFEEKVIELPTPQEREEELNMLKQWMKEHGYEFH